MLNNLLKLSNSASVNLATVWYISSPCPAGAKPNLANANLVMSKVSGVTESLFAALRCNNAAISLLERTLFSMKYKRGFKVSIWF